jgi:hypothetical protein
LSHRVMKKYGIVRPHGIGCVNFFPLGWLVKELLTRRLTIVHHHDLGQLVCD